MKILACVYSCLKDPDERFGEGGEAILGWSIISQICRYNKVWALTHIKNKEIIEKRMIADQTPNVRFIYIGLPKIFDFLQKVNGGVQISAYFWQIKVYFIAKKLHRENSFNVFHHITYANDWMASYIGALLKIPYIRGPGGGAHRVPKGFLREYSSKNFFLEKLRSAGQWIFKHDPFFIISQDRASAILVCNKESFTALPEKWQRKAHFFPVNGISKEDFLFIDRQEKIKNIFSVITAGKLIKIKSFDIAIKAFKKFNDKFINSQLVIVGDGPEFPYLNSLVDDFNLMNKVKFEKWMPRGQLLAKMKSADVFIFPSLRDGGGAVVVEAMAAEKPIVCFDIAGPGLHVDENCGIKVKAENLEQAITDLAMALEKLYSNTEMRLKLGALAREKAEKEYNWDKLGIKLMEIYNSIL